MGKFIKVSLGETKFYINESHKTGKMVTTCTLKAHLSMMDFGEIDVKATAIAICTKEEYVEKIGKSVSMTKAETKVYKKIRRYVTKKWTEYESETKKFLEKSDNLMEHNRQYLQKF